MLVWAAHWLLSDPLRLIGAAFVSFYVASFVSRLFKPFLLSQKEKDLRGRYAKAGDWAVVTGASEGIGKALALELASRHFNICIIARSKDKLDGVGKTAVERYGVQTMSLVFDFATASLSDYESVLFPALRKLRVGILVNCVGAGYEASPIDYRTNDEDLYMMKVNCEPQVLLSKFFIPHFKAVRSGAIVNISSMCGVLMSHPYLGVYSGTKAFNLALGESLHDELKEFNIDVMNVTPGLVNTPQVKGTGKSDPKLSFELVGAAEMAGDVLGELASPWGVPRRTAGHRNHRLLLAVYEVLPTWLVGSAILKNMKGRFAKRQREGRR